MSFRINKTVISNMAWGEVDKSAIWQRLKKGLEENTEGIREAIREAYAVVKREINADLTQSDCWGPHHEIRQDGSVVLNRGGVMAAVAAIRGARSEPDLTAEQRREAEQHLQRHYRDLELEWPAGEFVRLQAEVTGEISIRDVPLAPGVDLTALKAGDPDPLEVVVEIPAGKSKRGWNYTSQAIKQIVSEIMTRTASGFLGHQKPEDVEHEFPAPVTHWVGALWRDDKAYIRGVVDAAAKDLKRWIRAGRVKQVSIFGVPTLEHVAGETQVTNYQLLSIDWTPLDRAGMPTQVVAVGEMDSIVGNLHGGEKPVTLAELIAKMKEFGVNPKQVVGEMGWKAEDVLKAIGEQGIKVEDMLRLLDPKKFEQFEAVEKAIGEIAQVFELSKEVKPEDLVKAVKVAREAQVKIATAERDKLVDKVIGEMVVAESARPLVKRMFQVPEKADEASIRKALGEMLEAEDVKKVLTVAFKEPVIAPVSAQRNDGNQGILRTRRVPI